MPGADTVTVYRDEAGDWRWRRVAANNERLSAATEGYTHRDWAVAMAARCNPDYRPDQSPDVPTADMPDLPVGCTIVIDDTDRTPPPQQPDAAPTGDDEPPAAAPPPRPRRRRS